MGEYMRYWDDISSRCLYAMRRLHVCSFERLVQVRLMMLSLWCFTSYISLVTHNPGGVKLKRNDKRKKDP